MAFYRSIHSVFECQCHVVWVTKYRRRVMTLPHEREYCEQILRRAATEYGMNIVALEVDEDHVHLPIEIPLTYNFSEVLTFWDRVFGTFKADSTEKSHSVGVSTEEPRSFFREFFGWIYLPIDRM